MMQAERDRKSEAGKEMAPRSQHRAYLSRQEGSRRKHADGPRHSDQSSLSTGQSYHSYGSKEHSVFPFALGKKKDNMCVNATVREYVRITERQREKWSHRACINSRTAYQRRENDDASNICGSRSLSCSHSCSSRSRPRPRPRSQLSKPWSPDAGNTVNSHYSYLHKSKSHEKLLLDRFLQVKVNLTTRDTMIRPKLPWEEILVGKEKKLDVEEALSVKSPEGSAGQDQPTKDQWSYIAPLNVTDEAAEKFHVSEVLKAANHLGSRDSMSGENSPHEITKADLAGAVNQRTEHVPGPGDHYPVTEGGKCYTSSKQTYREPVPCLVLFPLVGEDLGWAKYGVNNRDIDLELGFGGSSSKKRLPVFEDAFCEKLNPDSMAGTEVFSNGSMMECSPCENSLDWGSILSLSLPPIQK